MYNIIQLNDKSLSELQSIAQELGLKKTDSLKKEELVYKILDEQAIAGATKKVAADKIKEERKDDKKKRSRVSVKKETADKVFSASKNGEITRPEAANTTSKTVKTPTQPATPAADSLLAVQKKNAEDSLFYKSEYVPVTSFIHTVKFDNYRRIYEAYQTPADLLS